MDTCLYPVLPIHRNCRGSLFKMASINWACSHTVEFRRCLLCGIVVKFAFKCCQTIVLIQPSGVEWSPWKWNTIDSEWSPCIGIVHTTAFEWSLWKGIAHPIDFESLKLNYIRLFFRLKSVMCICPHRWVRIPLSSNHNFSTKLFRATPNIQNCSIKRIRVKSTHCQLIWSSVRLLELSRHLRNG